VPLAARGRAFGVLTLGRGEAGAYDDEDLALALELAGRAGLAIENARLYEERTETALALQESLLPPGLPDIPRTDIAVRYRPFSVVSEVGGDFYDVFRVREGEWGLAVGDVTGKGPHAAAITGLARHTLRAVASLRSGTGALAAVNDALLAESVDRFCTVAFARIRPDEHGAELDMTLAGHPPPLVVRAGGEVARIGTPGSLLGAFPEPRLAIATERLVPGDTVVLYTDGVVEARRGHDFFGEARLIALLRECAGLDAGTVARRIEEAVLDFAPRPTDDLALLVVRLT
jgi:serine phosphatase RsbU (regulator of sigma subunit)